ncbi:MAG: hypothetical protein PHP03_02835 [Candidatus Pacebacteria bacterium]|nr:hypothetical protein [Candidatus Paceibacterota bacterium]
MKKVVLIVLALFVFTSFVSAKEKEINSISAQGISEMIESLKSQCSIIEQGMQSLADLKKSAEKALALEETNFKDSESLNDVLEYCNAIGAYYENKLQNCRVELAFYEMLKDSGGTAARFQGGLEKNLEIFKRTWRAKEAAKAKSESNANYGQ